MNKTIQTIKYVFLDLISSSIVWFLFFSYRKQVVESDLFGFSLTLSLTSKFWMGMVLVPLFWIMLYSLFGHYRNIYRRSRLNEFVQSLVQTLAGVLVIFFVAILDDVISSYVNYYTSASVLFVLHFVFTYTFRFIFTSRTVYQIHNRQIGFKTLIIGGSSSAVEMYQNLVNQSKSGGNLIVGFVNGMDDQGTILKKYIPYLGSYKDLKKVIQSKNIEEVLIAIEQSEQNLILEEIINDLEGIDILIKVKPNNYDLLSGKVRMKSIFDVPLIEIKHDLMPVWQFTLKRFLDIVFSMIAIIILSPIYIVSIILVKLGSKGPVFFLQERIGLRGDIFKIIKFRSMIVDAEINGPQLSVDHDPRITKWGKFMRQYRIDELPQFWNVIIGEMSLVGPRPERLYFASKIIDKAPHYKHIRKVKPGITSWGMVRFGYASTVDEMVDRLKYDIIYIENMSIFNDLKVLIYTFKIVFQGRGK